MNPLNLYGFDLPDGWAIEKLFNFVDIIMGQSPPSETYNNNGDGLPFFQGKAEFGAVYPTVNKYCSKPNKIASQDDVLLSIRAPVGPTNLAPLDCCIGRGLAALHPLDNISSKFILYLFRSLEPQISKEGTGSTFKAINKQFIENLTIALPPLDEQNRILTKIEENFSELDKGIDYLKTAQEQLKVYRQSVLKAAFEGKLTEEWRETQAAQLEAADQLLERIQQERENRYQQQLNEWEEAVRTWEDSGKEGRKPSKPEELENLSLTEEELIEVANLPIPWTWAKLISISIVVTDGDHQAPLKENSGIPFVVISNIENNRISFESTMYVSRSYYDSLPEKRKPIAGDVLYTVTGSFGIPCLVDSNKEFCFQRHIALIRLEKLILAKFIFYFLQSRIAFRQAANVATGTAQKTVSLSGLRRFCIPLAPFDEQLQIVEEVEREFSAIDQLEKIVQSELQKSTILRQSILKKAFSGQLVPQDSRDESAEVLLERIRGSRTHQEEDRISVPEPKKQVSMKIDLSIIEVLQELNGLAPTQDVWRRSKHQENIEDFYAELKKQIDNGTVEEAKDLREEKKSYLRLKNEN